MYLTILWGWGLKGETPPYVCLINRLKIDILISFHQTSHLKLKNLKKLKIQTRNIQVPATEMFKVFKILSPTIVAEIFRACQNNYNLRYSSFFLYLTSKLSITGLKLIPSTLKELDDVNSFMTHIKKWQPEKRMFLMLDSYSFVFVFCLFFLTEKN